MRLDGEFRVEFEEHSLANIFAFPLGVTADEPLILSEVEEGRDILISREA